ncbi:hypothetical protein HYW20_00115 [Candidatus Woesearchaeota archaeon]|nr:hypothetical protein [Candidatus Woesearchaeota archaeon]
MADLAVSDYVFVDFDSHEANNDNIVFKAIATDNAAENLSYDNLNISNEIIEINGVNAKWVWVENLSIGDYIAVPDYENNTVKWERVTGIAALDEQQVYDLNIEGTHNFIANDIIAHNTGSDSNNPPTSNGIFPNISINTSGLVGLWYFNNESGYGENDSLVRDFSPDVNAQRAGSVRNNGTCVINATPTCPVYNFSDKRLGRGAMRFDGVNDFVDAGSDTSLDNLGPLTYSAWVNANSLGGSSEGRIISKETTSSLTSAFFLGGSKRLVFQRQHSTTALAVQSANNAVTLNNTWQHVVMTWDGSTSAANGVKFYVDGVEKAHGFNQDGDGSLTSDAARSLAIGGMYQDGGKRPFDGLIDEVSVWNRTLSSSEISQLYKRGAYRLNLSVRSCDDASCAGEDYSVNVTNSTKSSISALSNNRYVQYKAFFTSLKGSSENSTAPELYNVTVHYAAPVPQSPVINLNYTIPTYPMYNKNVTIIANVTDADANLLYVNFTLYAPNGSIINLTNASRVNDLHNASFNLTSYGTWLWNVTAFDSGGLTVKSSTGVIILMQINESLNASSVAASSPVAVYGHINLSNGSNASNTPISVFINEILANLTVNPSMNFGNLWDNTSFEYRTRINFNETTNLSRTFEHIKINISLAEGRLMNENGTNLFCNGSKIPFDAYALSNSNGWITKLEGLAELNFTQMENKTCYLYYGPDFNGTEITPNDGKGWDYAVQIVTHTCGTQQDISIGNNCTLSNITEWNFGSVTLCGSSDNIIINTWCYYKSTSTGTQSFQTCSDDGSELYANSTLFVNNAFCQAETCVTNSNAAVSDGRYYAIKSRFDEGGGGEVFRVRLAGTELLDTECFRYFGGDWQINASYGTEENIFRTDKYGNYNFTFNAPSSTATYNVKVNSTWANTIPGEQTASFTVADTTPPTVNTTFNVTNALVNSVVNFTGNVTDETGLSTANITYNVSGIITYVNFTLSGTSAQVSNVTTISAGGVYNFTLYVTDTSNNVRQNSTLLVVIDNEFTSLVNTTTRTIFGYGSGNLSDNVRYNATIGAIHTNKDATGITLEGAYYGEELGRTFGDSNNPPVSNGIFPNVSINTSGLVGLWYFNNESGYGENNSLVRDFSLDVNSERSGSVRNNGTAVNGAHYNFSDKILGRGAMDFDGVDDLVQAPDSASLDAITYNTGLTLSVWIRPAITYDVRPDGFATYALRRSEQFHLSYSGYDDGTVFIVMNAVGVKSIAYDFDPILQGQWYHFVGTLGANNGVLTLYKNGRFVSSASGLASMGTGTTFDIGSYGGTDYEFNGLIDEVSVWNRTLSSAEISQLYKRGAYRLNLSVRSCDDASCAGEDYSVNATNSTSSSISNLANNRYVQYKAFFTSLKDSVSDNSTAPELYNVTVHYAAPDTTPPKFTGNSTNLTTPVLNNTAAFSINASDGVGLQNVIFAWNGTSGAEIGNLSGDSNNGMLPYINTSGLVLLYHFNNQSNYGENDTNVTDFSVYVNAERFGSRQNNGSVYNGAHYNFTNKTLGKGAMDFDGVDDYVDAGTGNSLDAPNAFTISAWFKFMGTPDAYMAGKNRLGNPTTYNYQIQYFEGVLYNSMSQSGGTDLDLGYTWTPVLGRWYYILANYNGNDQKLYIDGQQVASINRGAITLETGSTFILNIGRRSDGTFYFNGSIDEVAIWNRSLSSAEIKELYARGNKFTNVSASGILPASTTSLNWTINYTLPQTGVVGWQFTANDTSGNMMQSSIFNFTVNAPPDTTPPKFTGNSTNLSTPVLNNTAAFSINVSDGVGLQNVIFAWNGTSGAEIGNISADSSNGIWPGINTSGLVGLWHFNNRSGENDTLFKDFSPDVNSERSGSFRNNASCRLANGECPAYNLTDKKFGQSSVDFDGVNNLINVTDDPSLEPQNITVSVWFKRVGNQQAFGKILAKGNGAAAPYASYKFEFNNDVTGSSIVWHTGYTDTTATTITLSPINNNQWHHIVGIYDTGVSRAYLDGNLMGSSIDNKNIFYDTVALSLGAHNDFYGYLNGTIDEVAIWNRSLSSSEIKELYARGNKFTNVSATGVLPASTTSLNWTYNITLPQTGVVAWQFTANDTSGNMMQSDVFNFTVNAPAPPDTTLPIVNTTFNISSPLANDVINFTGNVTDETGLSSANITYNISGIITYVNFTLSGTTGQVSNATKLPSTSAVINFTMYVTDTSNNVRQNSTLLVVTDNEFTSLVNTTTRTIFGYGSGNLSDNVRYNATIGAIHTNKDATGITL